MIALVGLLAVMQDVAPSEIDDEITAQASNTAIVGQLDGGVDLAG